MSRQRSFVTISLLVIVVTGAIMVTFALSHQKKVQTNSLPSDNSGSIQYTNAITNQSSTDLTQETSNIAGVEAINVPQVTIDGIDPLYSLRTVISYDQAASIQRIIEEFLLAHSGLADVHAAIRAGSIIQTQNQIEFLLVVLKPQTTYQVTITITNQYQTTPSVTFKQVE